MTNWNDIARAAPELAAKVQARFEATGLGYLATLRPNGFPRISGLEPLFADGELWLGMMPDSLKAKDLRRDPRFALQSANIDKQVAEGDARITATAIKTAPDELEPFRRMFAEANGQEPPPGPFHLFRADIVELTFLVPAGDHLVIESVKAGSRPKRIDRY
jgi:hypothetical protein